MKLFQVPWLVLFLLSSPLAAFDTDPFPPGMKPRISPEGPRLPAAADMADPERVKDLEFKWRGKSVRLMNAKALREEVGVTSAKVWEPHEKRNVTFEGFSFQKLLDRVYGERWRQEEEIVFTCVDGYQPSLPVERFLKYEALLARSRKDQKEFTLVNKLQNNEKVPLGPYYLIWKNLGNELRKEGAHGWPYQVVGVEIVRFADRFPQMAPPAKASDAARRGFLAFRTHCMSCHRMNGDGGTKGVELNYPVSVTEYFQKDWLRKWIAEPTSMRWDTTMPGLPDQLSRKEREKVLDDLIAYLEAMKERKLRPRPSAKSS